MWDLGMNQSLFINLHCIMWNLGLSYITGMQGCRARLLGKAAGQGIWARLLGKAACNGSM
jgi:hypothetical protein